MQQQQDKRTASQKIDDLERGLMSLYQTMDNMARDMMTIREAIKLLGNKLDAVVKASSSGQEMTDEVLAKIMVQNNVEELAKKVTDLVAQGVLAAAEEVSPNSFVVGRELSEDGTIVNPRMQFVVSALQAGEVKAKFPGAKVGQILTLEEGKWRFEVLEIYDIQAPKAPEAQAAQIVESQVEAIKEEIASTTEQANAVAEAASQAQSSDDSQAKS